MKRSRAAARIPEPQQERSRRTMRRLMEAAEEVIAERGVSGLTVGEVARRAGTAVGTIYTRFPDKDTFLRTLHDRFFARASVTADTVFDSSRRRNLPVRDLLAGCVRLLVRNYRARRGLLRALLLYVRMHDDGAFQTRAERLNLRFLARLKGLILSRRSELRHPDPERAVLVGLMMIDGAAKEAILFGEARPASLSVSDAFLVAELTRAICAHLGVETAPRRHARLKS
ncbi:MAG TPA: helix-turn-helix domain-containing protein [Candidatus Dormibacteraeota bacterium]|nr:helix-turn-helix domain-containing protein [Candidatus Dormibacteraeota bacterium]